MKVFCIEFSDPHWVQVMEEVARSAHVTPVYWTATAARADQVLGLFPLVVFHDNLQAVRGVPPRGFHPKVAPIDAELLDALVAFEHMALKMMERLDATGRTFSYDERVRHYQRLVAYWNATLEELGPDAVLMPITPHLVFDYVLYALCTVKGIPVLLFDRTAIPGRTLERFGITGPAPQLLARYRERLAEGAEALLSEYLESYLEKLRGDFSSGMAANFKLKLERLSMSPKKTGHGVTRPGALQVFRYEAKAVIRHMLREGLRAPRNYLKVAGRPPEQASVGFFRFHAHRWSGILKKSRLHALYSQQMRLADPSSPSIFVALHYQPERNTVPVGGRYADQRLMIQLIAECAPQGWQVVVKEHSWQLQPFSRGQIARDETFYRDLARIPNVTLVPMSTPSFELIDQSAIVATVAGSVGWEAINRGKPAMIFGDAWYEGCEGAYRIRTAAECRRVLSAAQAGPPPDAGKVRHFVAALDEVAIRAVLEPRLEMPGDIDMRDNASVLAASLVARLNLLRPGTARLAT